MPPRSSYPVLALIFLPLASHAAIPGDVNIDQTVNSADSLTLTRYLRGDILLDDEALAAADLAPFDTGSNEINPDGVVNAADLLILLRAIAGAVPLPTPPSAPSSLAFNPPSPDSNTNPLQVVGSTDPSATLHVYVNGERAKDALCTVDAGGAFTCSRIAVLDGSNVIRIVAQIGAASSVGADIAFTYADTNSRGGFDANECSPDPAPCAPDPISGTVVWTPGGGQPYRIPLNSDFPVPSGATLIVLRGTEIQFDANASLQVNGTLFVRGRPGTPSAPDANRVRLIPRAGSGGGQGFWDGIVISSTGSVVEFAQIDDTDSAIELAANARADILDNDIFRFSQPGIKLNANARAEIARNKIDDPNDTCIQLVAAHGATTIQENILSRCSFGIHLSNTSPTIWGNDLGDHDRGIFLLGDSAPDIGPSNIITDSCAGIYVLQTGDPGDPVPSPDVFENSIFQNLGDGEGSCGGGTILSNYIVDEQTSGQNLYPVNTILNAEENWWGSTDPSQIAAGIHDETDGRPAPLIDFAPFLAADGGPTDSTYQMGLADDAGDTVLSPNRTYQVLGRLFVPLGATWSVPRGVTLQMTYDPPGAPVFGRARIEVEGTLVVDGAPGKPAIFLSTRDGQGAQQDDWDGIVISPDSTGTTVDRAVVRHAIDGILIDSTFAAITASTFQDNLAGIHLFGPSDADISGGNVITANTWGIWLQGTGISGQDPDPTINGNDIFDNDVPVSPPAANIRISDFAYGSNAVIDATGNYWGSTVASTIAGTILADGDDARVAVDFSGFLDDLVGNGGIPAAGSSGVFSSFITGIARDRNIFEPNFDANDFTLDFETVKSQVSVTLRIYPEDATDLSPSQALRTIPVTVPTQGEAEISWDGLDDVGQLVPDDAYIYVVDSTDGGLAFTYSPSRGTVEGFGDKSSGSIPASYNAFENDLVDAIYVLRHEDPGPPAGQPLPDPPEVGDAAYRVELRVLEYENGAPQAARPMAIERPGGTSVGVPLNVGAHVVGWDGRHDQFSEEEVDGTIEVDEPGDTVGARLFFTVPEIIKPNYVIVRRTAPAAGGPGFASPVLGAPNIEVKSDPFLVTSSFEHLSHIRFDVDQAALVTVKILKPDCFDPDPAANCDVATLMGAASLDPTGNPHEVTWKPAVQGDSQGHAAEPGAESPGVYTFAVEAQHPSHPDRKSLYRGAIQVRR